MVKKLFGVALMIAGVLGTILFGRTFARELIAFSAEGVWPAYHVLNKALICLVPAVAAVTGAFLMAGEEKALAAGAVAALVLYGTGTLMRYLDTKEIESFTRVYYPSRIVSEPRKIVTGRREEDLPGTDMVKVEFYEDFLGSNFRDVRKVEIVEDPSLGYTVAVEVAYRGEECQVSVHYYEGEEYVMYISMYPSGPYSHELTPEETAYMYKYREDIRYASSFAVEKLVIRTAYPDRLDISDIR